ncbi:MAG: SUMF1/EgtB/PvdO family nonheme iron enzyme [Spirochaetaceae bacterium]|jgi:formylglycine-generating enzyme required for sulfatase activity|nr:SUMF1/EgtB/PvdO family nonheme iron enzyme [Spirochaetaceae bacterium]
MKRFFAVAVFFCALAGAYAQEKYALVIGNGAYTAGALRNTINDANDMEAVLKSMDWTVEKILNGSRDQMEDAVIRLKSRLLRSRNSYGFFYYSGHGVQSNGENYLIPVDETINSENLLRQRAMSAQFMLDELNDAGNALNVIVLDACRDFPAAWTKSANKGLAVASRQPAESIIIYATSAGSTASDGEGRNGLFTAYLLNNMKIVPALEVAELFRRTMGDVARASGNKQRPAMYSQFSGIAYLGRAPAPQPVPSPAAFSANFVRIPGGTFTMGSPESEPERDRDEGPQHSVTINSFFMGKYEVTQKEWREVMGTTVRQLAEQIAEENGEVFDDEGVEDEGDNYPMYYVSWYDAVEYCNRRSQREGLTPAYTIDKIRRDPNNYYHDPLAWTVTWNRKSNGYRLPTEAEWEYACRAGTTTPFHTGNNITTSQANYNGHYPYNNGTKGIKRMNAWIVGSGAANAWGLYDMSGNVEEWCWDWYDSYSAGSQTDPVGASSGTYRVFRGGSWYNAGSNVRSASRSSSGNTGAFVKSYLMGFRLVRSAN